MHGHLAAKLDPLGSEPVGDPALEPERLEPPLTPELQARIPSRSCASTSRARRSPTRCRALRETYCGTIAYEIEHISDHEERVWLRQAIESGRYRQPLSAEEKRKLLERLTEVAGLRALPAARVPRPEAVLDRGPRRAGPDARRDGRARRRERHAPGRARHGAPRPPERDRAHARPPVRVRAREFEGERTIDAVVVRSGGRHRRREVPPRRRGDPLDDGRRDPAHARVEPEPPRGRRPGRRGDDARGADRPRHAQGPRRPERRASGADPRRRRVPRAGRRRRDAQPSGAARLLDRRHAPRDREQPGRLHDRSRRRALDPPLERPRQGLRRADHPRQRRRPGGGALGGRGSRWRSAAASATTS